MKSKLVIFKMKNGDERTFRVDPFTAKRIKREAKEDVGMIEFITLDKEKKQFQNWLIKRVEVK